VSFRCLCFCGLFIMISSPGLVELFCRYLDRA
jgi:hypothetical protein